MTVATVATAAEVLATLKLLRNPPLLPGLPPFPTKTIDVRTEAEATDLSTLPGRAIQADGLAKPSI